MRIQHNITALNAYRNYNNNTSALGKNLEKLSSGYKINRAGDDAAGLAISEKMRAQITGLNAAQKNVKDGISLVKTGEGAMQEIHDMLNRMDYLATQSANGTYDNEVDRLNLQKEVDSLKSEINRIADSANFNGIKLLDGSLAKDYLATEAGITTDSVSFAEGIEVTTGQNGGGDKGTFSMDITQIFGNNDKLDIVFNDPENGTTTTKTLTFGTEIQGSTAEEQAESIMNALSKDNSVAENFDVTREGSVVTLTSKEEGNKAVSVTSIAPQANSQAVLATATKVNAASGTSATYTFTDLFKRDGGVEINTGDVLTFSVDDQKGNTWTAQLTVTAEMTGTSDKATAVAIKKAFTDGNVKFTDIDGTIADEGIPVKNLFTVSTSGTDDIDLVLTGAANKGTEIFKDKDLKLTITDNTGKTKTTKTATKTQSAADGTAGKWTYKLNTGSNGDTNLSTGDEITITGKLSDGRGFSTVLTAGTDFTVGSGESDTWANVAAALKSIGKPVTVTNADGTTEEVDSMQIFGDTKELKVSNDPAAAGLVFESTVAAKGLAATIDGLELTKKAETGDVETNLRNGAQQTSAVSTIQFSDGVKAGATIEIDGTTYELVKEAGAESKGNVGVVVGDDLSAKNVAKALADTVNAQQAELATPKFTAKALDGKVLLTTSDVGSTAAAPVVETAGDTAKSLSFTLDPEKVQSGSIVQINGTKYEFLADGAELSDKNNIAVYTDLKKATAQSLADALKKAASGQENAKVSVDASGVVTVRGVLVDGEMTTPTARFYNGKGGLTLQIGDTADDFNQMRVGIGDMHTYSLGGDDGVTIDSVNIANQEDAKAAISVIKNAINYVSSVRGDLGAIQNRLDHTANNLSVMAENIQDAESTIRDTDVAEEMMNYVKNNILVQSAQAMLAQANQLPQGVLQLLG